MSHGGTPRWHRVKHRQTVGTCGKHDIIEQSVHAGTRDIGVRNSCDEMGRPC